MVGDFLRPPLAAFVFFLAAFPFGGTSTPARRAFERPMAIACLADRAPCLPSRTCSISSRTNSPACVVDAFPSRFFLRARSMVFFCGMVSSFAICILRPIVSIGRGIDSVEAGCASSRYCRIGPTTIASWRGHALRSRAVALVLSLAVSFDPVAALAYGEVHGFVGVIELFFLIAALLWKERDTDAGRYLEI